MRDSTHEQRQLAEAPLRPALAIAPAGCGKTESLALRARTLVLRGDVVAPRKLLALTFSNKARENLARRIRDALGNSWRDRVTVTNFHGLAGRILAAHGAVVGIPASVRFPEEPALQRLRKAAGVTYANSSTVDTVLRAAKSAARTDSEVLDLLAASKCREAVDYQQRLVADGALDYDDLLRHCARLLSDDRVRRLYQAHFAGVLVDEVQDLSLFQLNLVLSIGGERTTFVGDPAQGIYSFAGAQPEEVFREIRKLNPSEFAMTLSFRSSPRVLEVVNSTAELLGAPKLSAAYPDRWGSNAVACWLESEDVNEEAQRLNALSSSLQERYPGCSIGIIARRGSRLDLLRAALAAAGVEFQDWATPTHNPEVVKIIRHSSLRVGSDFEDDRSRFQAVADLCRASVESADVVTRDELEQALEFLEGALASGETFVAAMRLCRATAPVGEPVGAGVHLLSAHRGKGQEFDYVFAVGLEEGHIPDFRNAGNIEELRILHVMLSRARTALVITFAKATSTRFGLRSAELSRYGSLLRDAATDSVDAL